jgi:molybdate transport system ATP-binding protein
VKNVNNVNNLNSVNNVSHASDVSHIRDLNDAGEASRALAVTVRKRLSPAFTLDISFSAPPGITIVFGESGSGKSTLLRTVAGLIEPDAGHIAIGSRRLYNSASGEHVPAGARQIGYVFQHLALFPHMSVSANIEYGLAHLPADQRRARTRAIAESFRIAHVLSRLPTAISGGERQRVALARSLVTDPVVLLLDEPLTALDHATASHIIDDLRAWNTAHGIPILYVTHTHREAFALGDRLVCLDGGRIVAAGTPHEILDSPASEPLARLAGFENLFNGVIVERRPEAGTMQCRLTGPGPGEAAAAGVEIEAPLAYGEAGDRVRLAIRAGDILLAVEEPRGLSARNVLRGQLMSLTREGPTVHAVVDAGARFQVHLTPGARDALRLGAGDHVWLIVKSHSFRIVSQ